MASRNLESLQNLSFRLAIDGIGSANFQAVEGVEARVTVVEESNEGNTGRRIPGRKSFGNIILRRGLVKDPRWYDWFKTVLDGQVIPRAGVIDVMDENQEPQLQFAFREAWPCRIRYGDLTARENGLAIEEIEIVIEDLSVEFK